MIPVCAGDQAIKGLIRQLGLPDNVTELTIKVEDDGFVTATATILLDTDQVERMTHAAKRYRLVLLEEEPT